MRLIDVVFLKGSNIPMKLYTYDMCIEAITQKGNFAEELNRAVDTEAINKII